MPSVGPIKRRDLIRCLRRLGFSGPFPGGRHEFMEKGAVTVIIPNPHRNDISVPLLLQLLREAGISREDWERL